MNSRKYFIPGVSFELLAKNDDAIAAFRTLLRSIAAAGWDVTMAEEKKHDDLTGLELTMTR